MKKEHTLHSSPSGERMTFRVSAGNLEGKLVLWVGAAVTLVITSTAYLGNHLAVQAVTSRSEAVYAPKNR